MNKGFNLLVREVNDSYPLLDMICKYIENNTPAFLSGYDIKNGISYRFFKKEYDVEIVHINGYNNKYEYFEGCDVEIYIVGIFNVIISTLKYNEICCGISNIDAYINKLLRKEKINMLDE